MGLNFSNATVHHMEIGHLDEVPSPFAGPLWCRQPGSPHQIQ